jgi:hypothetical protein
MSQQEKLVFLNWMASVSGVAWLLPVKPDGVPPPEKSSPRHVATSRATQREKLMVVGVSSRSLSLCGASETWEDRYERLQYKTVVSSRQTAWLVILHTYSKLFWGATTTKQTISGGKEGIHTRVPTASLVNHFSFCFCFQKDASFCVVLGTEYWTLVIFWFPGYLTQCDSRPPLSWMCHLFSPDRLTFRLLLKRKKKKNGFKLASMFLKTCWSKFTSYAKKKKKKKVF